MSFWDSGGFWGFKNVKPLALITEFDIMPSAHARVPHARVPAAQAAATQRHFWFSGSGTWLARAWCEARRKYAAAVENTTVHEFVVFDKTLKSFEKLFAQSLARARCYNRCSHLHASEQQLSRIITSCPCPPGPQRYRSVISHASSSSPSSSVVTAVVVRCGSLHSHFRDCGSDGAIASTFSSRSNCALCCASFGVFS